MNKQNEFIDKILLSIQKEKVIELHNNRMPAHQIQEEMNLSLDWINKVIEEADEQERINNTSKPY